MEYFSSLFLVQLREKSAFVMTLGLASFPILGKLSPPVRLIYLSLASLFFKSRPCPASSLVIFRPYSLRQPFIVLFFPHQPPAAAQSDHSGPFRKQPLL